MLFHNKNKEQHYKVASLFIITSLTLVLCAQTVIPDAYSQLAGRPFSIIVQLAKNPIARGDTQTITFHVFDAITHQPVSGATVFAIVRYADGMTVRTWVLQPIHQVRLQYLGK